MYWAISGGLFFWAVAYAGLVYFSFTSSSPETLESLVTNGIIRQTYADYILAIPTWVKVMTIALAGLRLIAGAGLLFKQKWSFQVYVLALLFTSIIMFRAFFFADVISVIRPTQVAVEGLFIVVGTIVR